MSEVSVSGDTAVLTLAQAIPGHARASVVYEAPSDNPLRGAPDSLNSGTVESFSPLVSGALGEAARQPPALR